MELDLTTFALFFAPSSVKFKFGSCVDSFVGLFGSGRSKAALHNTQNLRNSRNVLGFIDERANEEIL